VSSISFAIKCHYTYLQAEQGAAVTFYSSSLELSDAEIDTINWENAADWDFSIDKDLSSYSQTDDTLG
jgi:hypothetical protein